MKDVLRQYFKNITVPTVTPLLLILAAALPLVDHNTYHLRVLTYVYIYMALSLGLNLLTGHAGIIDLGYIAFYAIGAYSYTLIGMATNMPFLVQVPILAALAIIVGIILGLPALRVRGDYLAVVTLGFGEIVRLIAVNWYSVTNGAMGIKNVPQAWVFVTIKTQSGYYLFAVVLLAIVAWLTNRLVISGVGWAWCALKTNEDLGKAFGHNVVSLKLLAFCVGATVAVICGAFFASLQSFISPESFVLLESIIILSMVILGGGIGGNLMGVAIGAFTLALLPELFRQWDDWRFPVYGIVMTVLVMRREKGILWFNWLKYAALPKQFGEALHIKDVETHAPDHANRARPQFGIDVNKIERSFGGVKALNGLTFRFEPGMTYGIIGHNGAGKTTLMNVISGVLKPTGGAIKPFTSAAGQPGSGGKSLGVNSGRLTARTFQKVILVPDLNAQQNVLLACYPAGLKNLFREIVLALSPFSKKRRLARFYERVNSALKDVSFPQAMLDVSAAELPFGLKRKVELARALAVDAPVLLLDEPLSGLSNEERAELYQLLRKIAAKREKTIILVEHQISYMEALCDKVFFMESGNIAIDKAGKPIIGDFQYVFRHPDVQQSYFGMEEGEERKEAAAVVSHKKPVLNILGLNVSYVNRGQVIYEADIEVPLNSIVLISGLNGSGKTTILKSIMALGGTQVDSGDVIFNETDLRKLRANKRALMGIFYVPQENRVFESLTVREHFVLTGIHAATEKGCGANKILDEWFPVLKEKWNVRAQDLSGGQQQMLTLALAFSRLDNQDPSAPCLIILDEPTTGLQPSLQLVTYKILRYYCDNRNVGILFTEQRPEAANIVNRHYKLEAGHLASA